MAVQPPTTQAPQQPAPPPPSGRSEEESRILSILEHLQELRYRLTVCAGALVIGIAASAYPLTGWFIDFLKEPARDKKEGFDLIFTDPLEGWTAYFRITLLLGVAIAMPVIVYQVMAFVSPGLTKAERRWVLPIVLGASLAFVAGLAFAYYVELPPALGFLLNPPGDVGEPFISVNKYFNFVTRLLLVTGLVFEMPLVIMGFAKLGMVKSRQLISWWRYAIILAFLVAAIVTPSVDPVTQSLVAGPMLALYCLGIVLAKLVENNPLFPR